MMESYGRTPERLYENMKMKILHIMWFELSLWKLDMRHIRNDLETMMENIQIQDGKKKCGKKKSELEGEEDMRGYGSD